MYQSDYARNIIERGRRLAQAAAQATGPAALVFRDNVLNAVQGGFEAVPDIVWDMTAEQRADAARYGQALTFAAGVTGLISDSSPTRTRRIRGSSSGGSSHPPPFQVQPPRKRLRSNILSRDWLHISSSPSKSNSRGSTQSLTQASQNIRRERLIGPWIRRKKKVLSWFRTRVLVKARARKRRLNSRAHRSRRGIIAVARHIDNLQRRYRKYNRWNLPYSRHLLRRIARGKSKLHRYRRTYRRYGFLPQIR